MKWSRLALAVLGLGWGAALRADEPTFTQKLSADELHRAGLDKLTQDERAELDRLVAGTKTVTRTVVKEVVKEVPVPAADPTPEAVAARATGSASAAEAGGWLNWLHPKPKAKKEGPRQKEKPAEMMIIAHIVGKFSGWGPHTVFILDNGQAWAVSDGTSHNLTRPQLNPEVRITPKSVFGYMLEIPSADAQTRVRPMN
jgi:hypothetical protein